MSAEVVSPQGYHERTATYGDYVGAENLSQPDSYAFKIASEELAAAAEELNIANRRYQEALRRRIEVCEIIRGRQQPASPHLHSV